uniref:Uncharacterized protein n=1 Tax=Suricata suricatta TaxID=37032 RepID=A0A673VEE8_SURSU
MFLVKCLPPKLEPKDRKWNMVEAVMSCMRDFLICLPLLRVTPFILKRLNSI